MELTVGAILEGKVKSITTFGAFVTLPENKTGMVHISEVANTYVSDIHQYLTEGQDVKVMVIGLDNGKINLSIKRLEPRQPREAGPRNNFHRDGAPHHDGAPRREGGYHDSHREGAPYHDNHHEGRRDGAPMHGRRAPMPPAAPKTADQLFEEKLKQFMSESDSKISSIKQYSDHRTRNRRR